MEPEPVGESRDWLPRVLSVYSRLHGLPDAADAEMSTGSFEDARARLHDAACMELPGGLCLDECRLEFPGARVEGEVVPVGLLGRFHAFDEPLDFPQVGTEVRLRQVRGSLNALVLAKEGDSLLLARAPTRREHRKSVRVPVEGIALLRLPVGEGTGSLFDLSVGGAGLTMPYAIEVGASVHLVLRIDGKRNLPLECDAVVTSCRQVRPGPTGKHRVGVKFEDLPDSLLAEIRRAIRPVE